MGTPICAVQETMKGKNKRGAQNVVVKRARGGMNFLVMNLSLMPKNITAPSVGGTMVIKCKCLLCTLAQA